MKVTAPPSTGGSANTAQIAGVVQAALQPVAAPTNLRVTRPSAAASTLTWAATPGAASYNVYRAPEGADQSGPWALLGSTPQLTYTDSAASGDAAYAYAVAAVQNGIEGAKSAYTTRPAPWLDAVTLFRFDEGSGTTTRDSKAAISGTVSGPAQFLAAGGLELKTGAKVEFGDVFDYGAYGLHICVDFLVYDIAPPTSQALVTRWDTGGGAATQWYLGLDAFSMPIAQPTINFKTSAGIVVRTPTKTAAPPLALNTRQNIEALMTADSLALWSAGDLITRRGVPGLPANTTGNLRFGATASTGFNGVLYTVRILQLSASLPTLTDAQRNSIKGLR